MKRSAASTIGRPRVWWLDALAAVVALGVAQAVVFGVVALIDSGRDAGAIAAADTVAVFGQAIDSTNLDELAPLQVELNGEVSGLFPGSQVDLVMMMTNPTALDILVDTVSVAVGQPDQPGCPTAALLIGADRETGRGLIPVSAVLPAENTISVTITVSLSETAPSACQGAVFPLTYRSVGQMGS